MLTFAQLCGSPAGTGTPATSTRTPTAPAATSTLTPETATPIPTATPGDGSAYGWIQGRVPAEWPVGLPVAVDLMISSGAHNVVAAQSYLTFTTPMLHIVDASATSCDPVTTLTADRGTFDTVLQNEVCNGPANCNFRGNPVDAGSIAFASASSQGGVHGDFSVAHFALCATSPGTAVLRWQFSPPAPPNRHSAVMDASNDVASSMDHSLYVDYVIHVGPTGTLEPTHTPQPTGTAGGPPTATRTPVEFTDVHPSDYFYEAVRYLSTRGVISGYLDGTFRPYNNTTRGQLCKIVVLGYGVGIYTPATPTFTDVPSTHAFYQYVESAHHAGLVSGYGCGANCLEFRPGNSITRGQLSKVVVLAANWTLRDPSAPAFRDVLAGSTFYRYVETAFCHGIISGYTCGTGCLEFRPGANATRGQISKIVYQALVGGHACP
jgi:S-layer homology domain